MVDDPYKAGVGLAFLSEAPTFAEALDRYLASLAGQAAPLTAALDAATGLLPVHFGGIAWAPAPSLGCSPLAFVGCS